MNSRNRDSTTSTDTHVVEISVPEVLYRRVGEQVKRLGYPSVERFAEEALRRFTEHCEHTAKASATSTNR